MRTGHRRDQDSLHPVLFQQLQVVRFFRLLVVAVAQDQRQARFARLILHAAGDVGEERVRHVEHDQADGAAPAGPQLARRLVPDEPQLLDRGLHPDAGGLGNHVRPVEHIGHRANGDASVGSDIPDADRRVCHGVLLCRQCPARYWNVSNTSAREPGQLRQARSACSAGCESGHSVPRRTLSDGGRAPSPGGYVTIQPPVTRAIDASVTWPDTASHI